VNFPVEMDDGGTRMLQGYRVQHNITREPAKGGVSVDPKRLSIEELENLTRRYAAEIAVLIGPESDIPTPDVVTNSQVDGLDNGYL